MDNIKSTFIRKRGNNYNVIVEYYDEKGKLKQKSVGKYDSKKEADKHLVDLKSSINKNSFVISKDITLVDRCYKFLEDNTNNLSPYTIKKRKSIIKVSIEPFFTNTKLNDVTVYQLQQWVNKIYKEHGGSSAEARYASLRVVLRDAYRFRETNENITDFIKVPKKNIKVKATSWTKEEALKAIKCVENKALELPLLLMLLAGLRKGEAMALSWDDVDFKKNTIFVNKSIYELEGNSYFKDPKTENSKRIITVPNYLIEKMIKEKERQSRLINDGVLFNQYNLVCLNTRLEMWKMNTLFHQFARFCNRYDLRRIRMYDLRHSSATLSIAAGTDIKTVSTRLGHSDIRTTLNIYTHTLDEMDKKASDNLEDMLFKK
nr:MAG TPA: Integrase [Caudoviricetes sp.]